jgi:ubiquinone/menaquinone biosynthesis C-methylase UbiE
MREVLVTDIGMTYVDAALDRLVEGADESPFWRAFHWGLFDDPEREDDSPERYHAAGEAMTEHIVTAAGVGDGCRLLDVGCGFGGTLDHIDVRNPGSELFGLNIDERQLRQATFLLTKHGRGAGAPYPFIAADGCRLPVADNSLDHVLAVECIFHFPSRKQFFREAARVLKPGGTVALSDFVKPRGAMRLLTTEGAAINEESWFGRSAMPLTAEGYARMGRSVGLDPIVDDDVTARTLPTYPALRRIYIECGAVEGVPTIDGCEQLARSGQWQYHVLAFRKRGGPTDA